MAHMLHMPHDCPALEHILQQLDCDKLWNPDNAIEVGYAKAGLDRYLFHKLGSVLTHGSINRHKETIESNSDSRHSSKAFNSEPKAIEAKIKIENPSFVHLSDKIKVVKSAKTRLEKELGTSEDLLARLVARNKGGEHTELLQKVEDNQSKLVVFLKDVRQLLATVGMLTVNDVIDAAVIADVVDMVEACKAHQTGIVSQTAMMKDVIGK